MKLDETRGIQDIAARREMTDKPSPFKCVSPSSKRFIIGITLLAAVVLGAIYMFTRPPSFKKTHSSSDDRVISRLMPRDEITPEYIESLGADDAGKKTEKKDEQKDRDAKPEIKPASPSMMLYTSTDVADRLGSLGVPLGTELTAVLENDVITDDRAVPVIARITRGYRKDGKSVVPINAQLFGSTQGMIEDRINVKFTKIVFPDGKEYPFSGVALDSEGVGGVPGSRKKKRGKRGAGVLSSALIGASTVFAPGGAGFVDTALRGAHRGASGELMRDSRYYQNTEATPVVTIRSKTTLTVLVDKAV